MGGSWQGRGKGGRLMQGRSNKVMRWREVSTFVTTHTHSHPTGPGIAEGDENCKKFLEKTMGDAFSKVHVCPCTSGWYCSVSLTSQQQEA